uniref:DUF834 domain-containing protein n=1 Tax=Oryza glumipatula TaxID=40148 RepID=A0A0E0AZX3_9ORYZ
MPPPPHPQLGAAAASRCGGNRTGDGVDDNVRATVTARTTAVAAHNENLDDDPGRRRRRPRIHAASQIRARAEIAWRRRRGPESMPPAKSARGGDRVEVAKGWMPRGGIVLQTTAAGASADVDDSGGGWR